MNIRKPCNMATLYSDIDRPIRMDSPEIVFWEALLSGDADKAKSLFREKKMYWDVPCAVDAPYGRFEGLDAIEEFVRGFLPRFRADSATLHPKFQTIANGRVALEAYVDFAVDGMIEQVPFFLVADFRTPKLLEEVRLYTHFSYVPCLTPYRAPIFPSAHLEMGDPGLLTGPMRAYYEALHHAPLCDADAIHRCFAPDCRVGGYEPWTAPLRTPETDPGVSEGFAKGLATYIPACVGMRYETIVDDGRTCVIEWVHIVSRRGREERNRVAMSGVSAYERDDEGRLCSVRICDYAGHEGEINWDALPITKEEAQAVNFVEAFPAGCGRKPQVEP